MIWLLAIAAALAARPSDPILARLDTPLRHPTGTAPRRVVLEGGDARALARAAAALSGVHVEVAVRGEVQLTAPPTSLRALAALPGVRRVRPPFAAIPFDVTTQGLSLMMNQDWHALGLTGRGIKIAVLDVGFEGYQDLLGTELPSSVGFHCLRLDNDCTGDRHGTAVAEIVHDFAPDAQIDLYSVQSDSEWLAGAEAIAQGDYDVVTCSIGFGNLVPEDGTGEFAAEIDHVVDQTGALWFQAAGNENWATWAGTVTDTNANGWLEMHGLESLPVLPGSGNEVFADLRWDDPWGGASDDIDLVLVARDAGGSEVTCTPVQGSYTGDATQAGGPNDLPWEEIDETCPSNATSFALKLKAKGGSPAGHRVWLVNYNGIADNLWTNESSISTPADAREALAVGAVGIGNLAVFDYSGRGPTDDARIKPDFVGPAPVDTSIWPSFDGTSAATPHLAGLAALVVQDAKGHGKTRADIIQWLADHSADLGDPGKDNDFGWGLPQVDAPWFPPDTGDTGGTDTGTTDTATDTGTTDTATDTATSDTGQSGDLGKVGSCACTTGPTGAAWLLWLPLLVAVRRRHSAR